ncbi:MAG TPA: hypothetical protein VN982_15315 [Candidatus Dormibacteraeota bacterium]|nr:hypothetical protein [Candidatus Dormibacteraeota bacterium]
MLCLHMPGLSTVQGILWAATFALEAALFLQLVVRKQYKEFPFFSAYILGVLLQSVLLFFSYWKWGYESNLSAGIAWSSQGVVVLLRALVVAELCRRLAGLYRGVWALIWRTLVVCAAIVLSYSLFTSKLSMPIAIVSADRGLELTIATVVVIVFLFAAYYGIVPQARVYFLAAGLCLYSCFFVINDSFLERWMNAFAPVWNFAGMISFMVSLGLWCWGFLALQFSEAGTPHLLPKHVYRSLSPQLNQQLRQLNDRLSMFWQTGEPRS